MLIWQLHWLYTQDWGSAVRCGSPRTTGGSRGTCSWCASPASLYTGSGNRHVKINYCGSILICGGQFFVNCSYFCGDVILWMHRFSVSIREITLFKFFFFEDVNSLGRATHEYYENWVTMNSNDSTEIHTYSTIIRIRLSLYYRRSMKGNHMTTLNSLFGSFSPRWKDLSNWNVLTSLTV